MNISAAQVNEFRKKTGLPMMECKKALVEAGGDEDKAIELLRQSGKKTMDGRSDRETEAGRIALYTDPQKQVTGMVELLCESAPVANTDEFITLVNALAQQLATGPGAATAEELLAQPFPGKPGMTLQQYYDDLVNKIREVFRLTRLVRIDGPCGAYVHHNSAVGVILPIEGTNIDLAKDICMHVAAMRPKALGKDDLDPVVLEKERKLILEEVKTQNAGKPENILEKIADGKVKSFLSSCCLLHQEFVKDTTKTVIQVCDDAKIKIKKMIHWELGR